MYINFKAMSMREGFFGDTSTYTYQYSVESKNGYVGTIYFTKDADGSGALEFCKQGISQGFGDKIKLEELLSWLESRETENKE